MALLGAVVGAAFVEASFAFALAALATAAGGHLGVELLAVGLAVASDPAVEASAAEGAGSCGRSAAAAFTATAAAPSCAAALAATAAAPSCAAALAAFAAFALTAALREPRVPALRARALEGWRPPR